MAESNGNRQWDFYKQGFFIVIAILIGALGTRLTTPRVMTEEQIKSAARQEAKQEISDSKDFALIQSDLAEIHRSTAKWDGQFETMQKQMIELNINLNILAKQMDEEKKRQ